MHKLGELDENKPCKIHLLVAFYYCLQDLLKQLQEQQMGDPLYFFASRIQIGTREWTAANDGVWGMAA